MELRRITKFTEGNLFVGVDVLLGNVPAYLTKEARIVTGVENPQISAFFVYDKNTGKVKIKTEETTDGLVSHVYTTGKQKEKVNLAYQMEESTIEKLCAMVRAQVQHSELHLSEAD